MLINPDNLYGIKGRYYQGATFHLVQTLPPKIGPIAGAAARVDRDTALRIIRWLRRHGHRAELV